MSRETILKDLSRQILFEFNNPPKYSCNYKKDLYLITNKTNGKVYVGVSQCVFWREKVHFSKLRKNKHSVKDFQEDYNRGDEFELKILVSGMPDRIAFLVERYFMIKLKTYDREFGYNYLDGYFARKGKHIGIAKELYGCQE